jgi:hypothetical protein
MDAGVVGSCLWRKAKAVKGESPAVSRAFSPFPIYYYQYTKRTITHLLSIFWEVSGLVCVGCGGFLACRGVDNMDYEPSFAFLARFSSSQSRLTCEVGHCY